MQPAFETLQAICCSIGSEGLSQGYFVQNFFVPDEYMSTSDKALVAKTADNGIVFCLQGGLAIVRHGLNFGEQRILN